MPQVTQASPDIGVRASHRPMMLAGAGAIAVFVAALAGEIVAERLAAVDMAFERLENLARIADENVSGSLKLLDVMLQDVGREANAVENSSDERDLLSSMNARTAAVDGLRTITISDAAGKIVHSTRPEVKGFDAGGRAYFTEPRDSPDRDRLFVTGPIKASLGVVVLFVSRPRPPVDGQWNGVATAAVPPGHFTTMLETVRPRDDGFAALIDRGGNVVAWSPEREGIPDGTARETGLAAMTAPNRVAVRAALAVAGEDVRRLVVVRATGHPKLFVAVGQSEKTVLAEWLEDTLMKGGAGGFVVFLAMLLLHRLAVYERELAGKTEALTEANRELQAFVYVVSHDLQEPLRTVGSFLELLRQRYQGRLDADADEFIGFAVEGAERMSAMVRDLGNLSRLSTRGGEFRPVAIAGALEAALANLKLAIDEAGAGVSLAAGLPTVRGDEGQLARLFQNLIGNAVKFRDHGRAPLIHVGAERRGRDWVFAVEDNGIGIEEKHFEKIFMIFRRLHGREEYEGTGIGLAVCKRIVERHGGRIWVESSPGKGSAFKFTIPADGAIAGAAGSERKPAG